MQISFIMSLVDDGIRYKSDNKKDGYELVDGKKYTGIGIKPQKVGIKPKSNTHLPNYSTVTGRICFSLMRMRILHSLQSKSLFFF